LIDLNVGKQPERYRKLMLEGNLTQTVYEDMN